MFAELYHSTLGSLFRGGILKIMELLKEVLNNYIGKHVCKTKDYLI